MRAGRSRLRSFSPSMPTFRPTCPGALPGWSLSRRLPPSFPRPPATRRPRRLSRPCRPSLGWAITTSCARSDAAGWASSTRPNRSRWAGGWPSRFCRIAPPSIPSSVSGFRSRPRRRPSFITLTLCRSSASGATTASITMRCSSSTGTACRRLFAISDRATGRFPHGPIRRCWRQPRSQRRQSRRRPVRHPIRRRPSSGTCAARRTTDLRPRVDSLGR